MVDLADQATIDEAYSSPDETWLTTLIAPGEVLLVRVSDELRLDGSLFGLISGLSHLARVGLAIHITSPAVMPRLQGYLTLELTNVGPSVLRVYRDIIDHSVIDKKVSGYTRFR
jgi:dCTP deaminase